MKLKGEKECVSEQEAIDKSKSQTKKIQTQVHMLLPCISLIRLVLVSHCNYASALTNYT